MKKAYRIIALLIVVVILATTVTAAAGPIDWLKDTAKNLSTELIAGVITFLLGAAGAGGIAGRKINRILKEGGEFIATLGAALEDNEITKEEVTGIYREYKDVVAIFKKPK